MSTTWCHFFFPLNLKLQLFPECIRLPSLLSLRQIITPSSLCLCLFRQLDWRPEKQGELRKRHEKVVIIRNMFHPSDFEVRTETVSNMPPGRLHLLTTFCLCLVPQEDPLVLNEYRDDLRTECEKFGTVKKVILFDVSGGQRRVAGGGRRLFSF